MQELPCGRSALTRVHKEDQVEWQQDNGALVQEKEESARDEG